MSNESPSDSTQFEVGQTYVSRRKALRLLGVGALASGVLGGCTSSYESGISTEGHQPRPRATTSVTEHYDLRRSGALCDGVSDDSAAWVDAVSKVSNAGGGKISWRGTTIASQIRLADKVGLIGLGPEASIIKQKEGRKERQHLILLEEPDARSITLQDFSIDGNRPKQKGLADAIHFDNPHGEGVLARHLIRNLHIRDVAGTGLFWGYQMRSSLIEGIVIYYCDGHGLHGNVFSDNTMQNVDVGQSGLHGIYLVNCYNSKFSNLKAWYSGRIRDTSAGIYQRNGAINVYSNILSQENAGAGMVMHGADTPINGVIVRSLNSDSDNTAQSSSNYGLSLNNIRDSIFDLTVTSKAPRRAKPYAGKALKDADGNKITAKIDADSVTWKVAGTSIGGNNIDLGRGFAKAPSSPDPITPHVYLHRTIQIDLDADRTIDDPVTPKGQPPVGFRYSFAIIQDKNGRHRVRWGNSYKIPKSTKFDTAPETRTNIEFECTPDGAWSMTDFVTGIPV